MKTKKGILGIFLLLVGWNYSCTQIENQQPLSSFEKESGDLPAFNIQLDSTRLGQTIRFDSIAQGGNFSLAFTPLTSGKIKIIDNGLAVEIKMPKTNWKTDCTEYTICKNSVCRKGKIVLKNGSFRPEVVDTNSDCLSLLVRTFYLPFLGSVEVKNLFPGMLGLIDSLKTDHYSFQKQGDSLVVFVAAGNNQPEDWAWDTLRYRASSNSNCYLGKVAFIIGDTCEAHARSDVFNLPTGNALWADSDWTNNDQGCNTLLGSYQTRIQYPDFDYGNFVKTITKAGILTDTLIGGNQHHKYQRMNPSAIEDGFYYYFKNLSSNRVTKAWIRITFN